MSKMALMLAKAIAEAPFLLQGLGIFAETISKEWSWLGSHLLDKNVAYTIHPGVTPELIVIYDGSCARQQT